MKKTIIAMAIAAGLFALVHAIGAAMPGGASVPATKPASAPASAPAETAEITLLHINDSHGRIDPYQVKGEPVGGYVRLASLVKDIRKTSTSDRVFLLHAGDVLSRGDRLTRRTLGAANVQILNHLGFDAWTPGNGEFYDGTKNLQARIREAEFPVLTANVTLKKGGGPLGREYVIERAGPVKMAIFGLCLVRPSHDVSANLTVTKPGETSKALVPKLREKADVVVALTHLGYGMDRWLGENVPGIDVIIGGHTHTRLSGGSRVKAPDGRETLIVQAEEYMKYCGVVNLKLRKTGGRWTIVESAASLVPLDEKLQPDAETARLIEKLKAAAEPGS